MSKLLKTDEFDSINQKIDELRKEMKIVENRVNKRLGTKKTITIKVNKSVASLSWL